MPRAETYRFRPAEFFHGCRWTAFRNIQGLEIEHATRQNVQIPSLAAFWRMTLACLEEPPRPRNRTCHAPKRKDSIPWIIFMRMDPNCLQEPPRAGNRRCHAPKRTDSVPWSFLVDDAGLRSRTSKGCKSSMTRADTHRFRPLDFFFRGATGWTAFRNLQELEIEHATRRNIQIPSLGAFWGMMLDCLQ